jgi:flagellar biosynthetic protein FliQ
MTTEMAVDIVRQALWQTLWLSLPLLAIGFVAGIAISILQILTSIQDTSFGAVPRLAAFLGGLLLLLPWMATRLVAYTVALFGDFGKYAR